MEPVAIVIGLALLEYLIFGVQVARARAATGLAAPATTGNADFERPFRVQQNTLEQLIIFVPAILLFGWYVSPLWGAALGLVFIVGRALYSSAYVRDPDKRGTGFLIGEIAQVLLLIGGIGGAVWSWI